MSKPPKVNFKDLVAGQATPAATPPEPVAVAEPAPTAEVVQLTQPTPETTARAARKAASQAPLKKRAVQQSLYLDQPVYEQLRELAFHERKAMHALVLEGLDLLFKKRGLKSLGQLGKVAS